MIEIIISFVSKVIFGKTYLYGYMKEPQEKEEYRLVSLFPNEIAKKEVISVLEKKSSF